MIGLFLLLSILAVALAGFGANAQSPLPAVEPQSVGPVTNLATSTDDQESGVVRLSWSEAENAQVHFVVYVKSAELTAGNYGSAQMAPFAGSEGVISGLQGGTSYHFIVIGMRWNWVDYDTVWGSWSDWVSDTTSGAASTTGGQPVPEEPRSVGSVANLTASTDGQEAGAVQLAWTEARNAQVHFVVYVKSAELLAGSYGSARMAPFAGSQGVIRELEGGTSYHFVVIGMRWNWVDYGTVWGSWSDWIPATPPQTSAPPQLPPATNTGAATDRTALVALYNATGGPSWHNSTNWLSDKPIGEWYGVTTDGSTGRVTGLDLFSNNLKGELPSELSGLTSLYELEISANNITGLSDLSDLTSLRVFSFVGSSDSTLSDISALSGLIRLEHLQIAGHPIEDVSPLRSLTKLDLLNISGTLVHDVSPLLGLTNLHTLDVSYCPLSAESINVHISILISRGVTVNYLDLDFTTEVFTVEDGPQIYNDNLFVLPVQSANFQNDISVYTRSFYKYFEDEFDFLMIIGPGLRQPPNTPFAFYQSVSNDVRGIGLDVFDNSDELGSIGRLQGVTVYSHLWAAQSLTFLHELMHRWGAFILISEISDGSHWYGASNIFGVLGGWFRTPFDEIVKLGENMYSAESEHGEKIGYAPLELYLAGFIPPEEVPEFWVAADAKWVEVGRIFTTNEIKRYTIDDVISVHGGRLPQASEAQREFRAAAILLIDEKYPATIGKLEFLSNEIAQFSHVGMDADDAYINFYEATGGRARIAMDGLSQFRKDDQR